MWPNWPDHLENLNVFLPDIGLFRNIGAPIPLRNQLGNCTTTGRSSNHSSRNFISPMTYFCIGWSEASTAEDAFCSCSVLSVFFILCVWFHRPNLPQFVCVNEFEERKYKTKMHSSRMRTVHCSGRVSCHACPPVMHAPYHSACPLPDMPPSLSPCTSPFATHTPLTMHGPHFTMHSPLRHTCPNSVDRILLRMVINSNCTLSSTSVYQHESSLKALFRNTSLSVCNVVLWNRST